ncbi:hypothetical protein [Streptomyces scopuliridis]|uniref:hypothetical protein n=1 Tax=Streptomyces scopuliridis TaxID=452529 RepID=UPI0036C8C1E3
MSKRTYTVTRPLLPEGVIVAKVKAADPADAIRKADEGTWTPDPGFTLDRSRDPEVWQIEGIGGRNSRHIQGPNYGG